MGAKRATRASRPARPRWVRYTKLCVAWILILVMTSFVTAGVYFAMVLQRAQGMMGSLQSRIEEATKKPTLIISSDGVTLYQMSAETRIPLRLSEIPRHVQLAVLAAEDKRFFAHRGYDPIGLARAAFTVARDKRVTQGGSTLTMQLAKLMYSDRERTIERKVQDIAIAWEMERQLSKEQILQIYLNQVYFGEGAYGIGAAAQVYFGKRVKDLTIAEAAMLARCVRRPSVDNPVADYKEAIRNKRVVLDIMRDEGFINAAEYRLAMDEQPRVAPQAVRDRFNTMRAPYFVQHVLAQLRQRHPELDLRNGGFRIETTVDTGLQSLVDQEVRRVVREFRGRGVTTGAFVLLDRDGRILAEMGGVDFESSQFNVVSQGARQPGSAFKPFIYAAALASGTLGSAQPVSNEAKRYWDPGSRSWYEPRNLGRSRWSSTMSLRTALQHSVNRPAVNTLAITGVPTAVAYARDVFGFPARRFQTASEFSLSFALGAWPVSPLELAEAYSVFMLRGDRVTPFAITRIIAPDGTVVASYQPQIYRRVLDTDVAEIIDDALRAVVEAGTARQADVVPNARGKTGTTNEGRDAWFAGYTDDFVGVGWVANYRREGSRGQYLPMPNVYGGAVTARIWAGVIRGAQTYAQNRRPQAVPDPGGVDVVQRKTREQEEFDLFQREPRSETPLETPAPIDEAPVVDQASEAPDPNPESQDAAAEQAQPAPIQAPPASVATTPKAKSPEQKAKEATEDIEVCVDTNLKADLYCPETVVRSFPRSRAPRRTCPMHRMDGGG